MKLYKSINTIPIYNFWKISTENDYRYLIKDVDIDELPDVKIDDKFNKAFILIFDEIKNIDLSIQNSYSYCQELFSKFLGTQNEKDRTKYNLQFSKYLMKLNEFGNAFEVAGIKNNNLISLFRDYKKKEIDYFNKQLFDFDFRVIKYKKNSEWDLNEEVVSLNLLLKVNIDIFKTSTALYYVYKERAKKQIEQQNKK